MKKIKVYQTKTCSHAAGIDGPNSPACHNPPVSYEMRGGQRVYTCPEHAPDRGMAQVEKALGVGGSALPRNPQDQQAAWASKEQVAARRLYAREPGLIEEVYNPEKDFYYQIKRGQDRKVYCTCAEWKYSIARPKICVHLQERGYFVECGNCLQFFANGPGEEQHVCAHNDGYDEDIEDDEEL